MKKLESSLTNMVVVLVAVAVITGGLLAWVNNFTGADKGTKGARARRGHQERNGGR